MTSLPSFAVVSANFLSASPSFLSSLTHLFLIFAVLRRRLCHHRRHSLSSSPSFLSSLPSFAVVFANFLSALPSFLSSLTRGVFFSSLPSFAVVYAVVFVIFAVVRRRLRRRFCRLPVVRCHLCCPRSRFCRRSTPSSSSSLLSVRHRC